MNGMVKIIGQTVGVTLTAALLLTAAVWGYKMTPVSTPCVSLEYIIEDKAERMYLTEIELNQLLYTEDIYPVGRAHDRVSMHRIEQAISRHPMVRTAECYITPRHEVKVRLTQRVPLLRVQVAEGAYFIDTDRRVMQARASVRDSVLVVTGAVGSQIAASQVADFAEWLQENEYWRAHIHHLHMTSPLMAYIYLGGENQPRVAIGVLRGYDRKLRKLRTFLEHSGEATKDKQYKELDVRFFGQVIGRY